MAAATLFSTAMALAIILSIIDTIAAADLRQSAELGHGCSPASYSYVNKTIFTHNRDAVFASLRSNLSSNSSAGFATAFNGHSGASMDPVYGLAQCRPYLAKKACLDCLTVAENQIPTYCPTSNGARIHMEDCFLRYENTSFFGQGSDPGNSTVCASSFEDKPQKFKELVRALLRNLKANASENKGYAVDSKSIVSDETLYGVAQCWQSLLPAACYGCLSHAEDSLLIDCVEAVQEGSGLEAGCFMRYATFPFFSVNYTSSLPGLPVPSHGKELSKVLRILLGVIGGAALIATVCVMFFWRHLFTGFLLATWQRLATSAETAERMDDLSVRETFEQVIFDYSVLRDATDNFDGKNVIGRGGFGIVYKGKLVNGREIAVKKLTQGQQSIGGKVDFLREVKIISSVLHRNLVRMLGCCARGHERFLVYEYMPNMSLDKHLFGSEGECLDWETRFKIMVGTARGLAYLHEDSNVRIVHRDIKGGNILLDDKFQPKIADFGMAKFLPEGESLVSTKVGGTPGYTAPEYAIHGLLTEKVDVYSYGMVVLEIVSGRKVFDPNLPKPRQFLLESAWREYENESVLQIMDPRLKGEYGEDEVERAVTVALLCTQASSSQRPPMSQVVSMLLSDSKIGFRPMKPAIADGSYLTMSSYYVDNDDDHIVEDETTSTVDKRL